MFSYTRIDVNVAVVVVVVIVVCIIGVVVSSCFEFNITYSP